MAHARTVLRHVQHCDETGCRSVLRNYILQKYQTFFANSLEYRMLRPDPTDEITDQEWRGKNALDVLIAPKSKAIKKYEIHVVEIQAPICLYGSSRSHLKKKGSFTLFAFSL